MTTANLTRALSLAPLATAFRQVWQDLRTARETSRAIAETRRELSGLSDRELDDLGIRRVDIDRIAVEAVLGR